MHDGRQLVMLITDLLWFLTELIYESAFVWYWLLLVI
jgi:hypothetical protein